MIKLFSLGCVALLLGCSSTDQQSIAADLQRCGEPRPQLCTMEYAPVCALSGRQQRKQYSNACGACADPAVGAYSSGPCPAELE